MLNGAPANRSATCIDPVGSTVGPDSPLVASARAASLEWQFNAAVKDGKPVETWVAVPVDFAPDAPADGT